MKLFFKPKGVRAEYRYIPTAHGKLKLLIVKPEQLNGQTTGVLWIHGGGFATGMAEMVYMGRAIDLVTKANSVVVSPAYRLSLRAPYPVALEQCHQALVWMKEHASELQIRDDQLMVGGESAGGGLTAALCLYERDHDGVKIAFQMPLYPMLDCYDTVTSADNHAPIWNTRRNHQAWKLYLRKLDKSQPIPVYASPARCKDYRGLPPCYSFVGNIEPFYQETVDYIDNLKKAGIDAKLDIYPDFYHAYDMVRDKKPLAKKAAENFLACFCEAQNSCFREQKKESDNRTD